MRRAIPHVQWQTTIRRDKTWLGTHRESWHATANWSSNRRPTWPNPNPASSEEEDGRERWAWTKQHGNVQMGINAVAQVQNGASQTGSSNYASATQTPQRPENQVQCYRCRQFGHMSKSCRNKTVPPRYDNSERKPPTRFRQQFQQVQQQQTPPQQQPQQQSYHATQQSQKPMLSQNHITPAANASSDVDDEGPIDCGMTEVLINIKLNGVAVKATFDTGSSATVVKESLWKRINIFNVTLRDSPFDFTSCSPDAKLDIRGYAMCKFECNSFCTRTSVTVIADNDLAKECLLGLRVVRSWPEMNNLFNKMAKDIGIEFGSISKDGERQRPQLNQINSFLTKALASPTIEIENDFKSLIATPVETKQQSAKCDACDSPGHSQEDCPAFQLDEHSLEWRFSKKRLEGHTPNDEIWSIEQEHDLTKPLREKLLTEHKLNKRLLALNLVTRDEETSTGDEIPVIDEEELDDADGFEDIGHVSARRELTCNLVSETPSTVTPEAASLIKKIRERFPNIIADPDAPLGQVTAYEHRIKLVEGAKPFKQNVRYAPKPMREEFHNALKKLLERKIIRESNSPFASPTVLIRKKTNELRICVDYRKLNEITVKDAYPIPKIDELVTDLGGAERFTTLDLAEGYYQVPIAEEDKHLTAFITEFGLFEFNVTAFGLTNAPATFQRMMAKVLKRHIEIRRAGVYMDDVAVKSSKASNHEEDVLLVCSDIDANKLRIKLPKCKFASEEIEFVGHRIRKGHMFPVPSKVDAITNFKRPTTVSQLKGPDRLLAQVREKLCQDSRAAPPGNGRHPQHQEEQQVSAKLGRGTTTSFREAKGSVLDGAKRRYGRSTSTARL
jgi:hypothetical protein